MDATSHHLAVDDVEMIVWKVETGGSHKGQCYAYISGYGYVLTGCLGRQLAGQDYQGCRPASCAD